MATSPTDPGAERRPPPRWLPWAVGVVVVALAAAGITAWQRSQDGPDVDAFCTQLADAAAIDDRLATDPAELDAELAALRQAAEVAPPEVAGDVEVLIGALTRLEAAAQRDPADPAAGVQDELRAMQPEVEAIGASAQAVGAYARDTCGLALAGTRSPGTASPGTDAPPAEPPPTVAPAEG